MDRAIIVLNSGSSSVRFSVFVEDGAGLRPHLRGQIEALYAAPRFVVTDRRNAVLADRRWPAGEAFGHDRALDHVLDFLHGAGAAVVPAGVGHRVVHGGAQFSAPVRIDATVLATLQTYVRLAPLHQPHNLAPIARLLQRAPQLPQVACFDTAFHRTNPELAQMFALPHALIEQGVRRYGFHGLSYEYIASVLAHHSDVAARGRTIVLHLGNGASMCALHAGRSVATTMGFTALDGLMMGTRCGSLDPGVLLYLMDRQGLDARALEKLLYHESGLLGVSGISSDMRALLASDSPRARLAIDLYCYRIGRELGSLAAALGGVDALVFTGGVGENAAAIRARVLDDAAWLGVERDAAANDAGGPRLTTPASRVAAFAIPTNEELMIARHTQRVIGAGGPVPGPRPR
jgi:acetate kinase